MLRRGGRGQGQHDLVGPSLAGPSDIVAGTYEGDSHDGIDSYTSIGETLNPKSYGGGSPQCFAEGAVGRGSRMLKGPSSQDPGRSWPAHAKAIHTMA